MLERCQVECDQWAPQQHSTLYHPPSCPLGPQLIISLQVSSNSLPPGLQRQRAPKLPALRGKALAARAQDNGGKAPRAG